VTGTSAPAAVEVRPVSTGRDRKSFVELPWRLYRGDPNWVPPIIADELKFMSPRHNPFFEHAEVEHFLAWRDGEPVGRIAATHNRLHNEFHEDRVGFFGLFETVDEGAVARALLDTAASWVAARGLDTLRGPMNYSTNETCGLLVDGFDGPPYIMMPYNPPSYAGFLERAGFAKVKDLVAYRLLDDENLRSRVRRIDRLAKRLDNVRVRSMNKKRWDAEVEIVRDIYNAAWERNWGFVPYTRHEFDHMAKSLKQVVEPSLVGILEVDGRPVGFGLGIPDANIATREANGRLFPFGLIKILLAWRKIHRARIPILGILQEFRGKGYDALLYAHIFRNGTARGFHEAELSWILEDNMPMRHALEKLGASVHRTYRVYDKPLD
jgi:GNAT superfamily N-acetyltransferase